MKTVTFSVILWLCLTTFTPDRAGAQSMLGSESVEVEMLHPRVGFGYSIEPRRSILDTSGSYSLRSSSMEAMIPLVEHWDEDAEGRSMYTILIRGAAASIRPDVSFLNRQHRLYTSTLGLTAGIVTSSRSVYSLSLNLGFAEDDKTVEDFRARFTGSFLATAPMNDATTILFGLSYSYNFDRALVLPTFGVRWGFSDRWMLNALFPYFTRVVYKENDNLALGFGLRLHGNRFRFSNEGAFGGEPETVDLRVFEAEFGFDATIRVQETLLLRVELGMLGGRRFGFVSGNDEFLSSSIKPAGYLTVGARFLFDGTKPLEE